MGVTHLNCFLGFPIALDVLPTMQVPRCITSPVLISNVPQVVAWPGVGSSDTVCGREDYTGLGRVCVISGV